MSYQTYYDMKKQLLLFAVMLLVFVGAQAQRFGCLHDFMQTRANDTGKYTMDNSIRSRYFSTSPYPYTNPQSLEVNDRLSKGSKPAAKLFTSSNGLPFMSKPITNIRMADDGTISFVFMNADLSGVSATMFSDQSNDAWFTIDGRSLPNVPTAKGFYIHGGEKVIIR